MLLVIKIKIDQPHVLYATQLFSRLASAISSAYRRGQLDGQFKSGPAKAEVTWLIKHPPKAFDRILKRHNLNTKHESSSRVPAPT